MEESRGVNRREGYEPWDSLSEYSKYEATDDTQYLAAKYRDLGNLG